MDELLMLQKRFEKFLSEIKEEVGGEKIQPYICVMEGLLKGMETDLKSDL